eukprot:13581959-Alexandrium_andersonii.AAC.1
MDASATSSKVVGPAVLAYLGRQRRHRQACPFRLAGPVIYLAVLANMSNAVEVADADVAYEAF